MHAGNVWWLVLVVMWRESSKRVSRVASKSPCTPLLKSAVMLGDAGCVVSCWVMCHEVCCVESSCCSLLVFAPCLLFIYISNHVPFNYCMAPNDVEGTGTGQ